MGTDKGLKVDLVIAKKVNFFDRVTASDTEELIHSFIAKYF